MKRTLQIANLIGFIITIIVNYLSNALPLNGKTAKELSDLNPNLFVPAPFTFSIWGFIYLLLIGFIVYQASDLFSKNKKELPHVEKIGWLFFLSCLLNSMWLIVWHFQFLLLSLVIMIAYLITLILIYQRLEIGKDKGDWKERILVRLPFQVLLGWISIATIANTTAVLVSLGFTGGGIEERIWAMVMISIGGVLALLMLFRKWDIAYSLVVVWAFYGIISERMEAMDFGFMEIVTTAVVCMSLIGIAVLVRSVQMIRS